MKEDWIEVELGKICSKITDGTHHRPEYIASGVPFISVKDIFNQKISFNNCKYISKEAHEKLIKRCHPEEGDLLITKSGTIGRMAIIPKTDEFSLFVSVALIKNFKEIIESEFLMYSMEHYLNSISVSQVIKGGVLKNFHLEDIRKTKTYLPPLPEQRAIVTKIEHIFNTLNKGIADLKKAQAQLKIYRQAVLKKAFEGELTKAWREQQSDLPTTDELLTQIKTEREQHYQGQVTNWQNVVQTWEANGKEGKKPRKPGKLNIPEVPNFEHLNRKWSIPNQWVWTQIGTICFVTKLAGFEYTKFVNYDHDGDLSVIKAENAGINGFKKTNYSKVHSESIKELTRSELFGGELLVVFVGAGTGNVAIVPFDKKYFLGPNIGMARPYFAVNTKYLEFFFRYSNGKYLLMAPVKAVAQPSLSMGTIRQSPVALPSEEEQHQIIQEIESRLSVCDKTEESITASLKKAEALRQSILKKAFEGKLLTPEELAASRAAPDWEPAADLLERIRKEKAK